MDNYSSYTIAFTNSVGTRIELPTIHSYLDPKPIVTETDKYYIVRYLKVDDYYLGDPDLYVECNISPGAHIILRHRGCSPRISVQSSCYLSKYDEDQLVHQFYSNGYLRPRAVIEGNTIELNIFEFADAWEQDNCYDAEINVYGQPIDAATFSKTVDWEEKHWGLEYLNAVFCLLHDVDFNDFIEVREFLTNNITRVGENVIKVDTTDYDSILEFAKDYIITCPDWAYYELDKFEHSSVIYSIAGTGPECRWDTSHGVGVWFLCEEEIKRLQEYFDKNPDVNKYAYTEKICRHDLKLISDGNEMYSVYDSIFSKIDLQLVDTEIVASDFWEEKQNLIAQVSASEVAYMHTIKSNVDYELKNVTRADEWRV